MFKSTFRVFHLKEFRNSTCANAILENAHKSPYKQQKALATERGTSRTLHQLCRPIISSKSYLIFGFFYVTFGTTGGDIRTARSGSRSWNLSAAECYAWYISLTWTIRLNGNTECQVFHSEGSVKKIR